MENNVLKTNEQDVIASEDNRQFTRAYLRKLIAEGNLRQLTFILRLQSFNAYKHICKLTRDYPETDADCRHHLAVDHITYPKTEEFTINVVASREVADAINYELWGNKTSELLANGWVFCNSFPTEQEMNEKAEKSFALYVDKLRDTVNKREELVNQVIKRCESTQTKLDKIKACGYNI